tara:strand:+ start:493 stop:696 length:204 start_codon:yes stop_codon:yes gene_type:complete
LTYSEQKIEECDLVWTIDGIGLIVELWYAPYIREKMAMVLLWNGEIKSFTSKEILSTDLLIKYKHLN